MPNAPYSESPTDAKHSLDLKQAPALEIYNTLTRQKQLFKPLVPNQIGLYVCGTTVYDYCHIGHARLYLIMDSILRYLREQGYKVTYVRNITDIDDKIIQRANDNHEPYDALAKRFITAMHEDFTALNLLPPDHEPKATEYVGSMINLIQILVEKGYAYVASNKDVYYDVTKFKSYGCLAHRNLEDLQAGSRIEINDQKRNPLDFVLWKSSKPNEPSWPSPWGEGRPGWHIECSAMSKDTLGETFDIHGGGPDLKFPHHENERAQSEAATGKCFVNTWMHVGYLQIDREKMSKSLGNFLTIREFLTLYHPEILRYFNLASHYRSPVEYSEENIASNAQALERMYTALRGFDFERLGNPDLKQKDVLSFKLRFIAAMNDDFNTPIALSVLFDLVREINRERMQDIKKAENLAALLKYLGNVLGILFDNPEHYLQSIQGNDLDKTKIEQLIHDRNTARKNKNWSLSDKIRDELTALGVTLEDTPEGTLWRKEIRKETEKDISKD